MSEVEETINRIKLHKSVQGIVIVNNSGEIIKSSYPPEKKEEEIAITSAIPQLAAKARSTVRDLDPTNDLTFLRIRSKNNEILVAPDKDFMLIVVQGSKTEKPKEDDK
eukprot:TRINITY_DN7826_c0_g1_i10.p2 TRINITY_DN7826_c0_g1~~TRINITY_DN7826_c0_g1_i10.p2  ORF type:complete len:108 (-),score=36.47 TRINITY_DN7826_c0_g1_i10:162-485(-)